MALRELDREALHRAADALDERHAEVFLAREVVVDRRLADADAVGEVLVAEGVEAPPQQDVLGEVEDALARLGGVGGAAAKRRDQLVLGDGGGGAGRRRGVGFGFGWSGHGGGDPIFVGGRIGGSQTGY